NSKVRFAEMQRFASERKAGIGNNSATTGEVCEKGCHSWFLEGQVSICSFPIKAVTDERVANPFEKSGQLVRGRSHVDERVGPLPWLDVEYFLAQDRGHRVGTFVLELNRKESGDQSFVRMWNHGPRHQPGGERISAVLARIFNPRMGERVLIIDRDYGKAFVMTYVVAERLEIGDNQVNLPMPCEPPQFPQTSGCARHGQHVPENSLAIAHLVLHVGEAQAVDLGDFESGAQVAQAAVEGGDMNRVAAMEKMSNDFFGARGMARAFAVHAVEDVGHRLLEVARIPKIGVGWRARQMNLVRVSCGPGLDRVSDPVSRGEHPRL